MKKSITLVLLVFLFMLSLVSCSKSSSNSNTNPSNPDNLQDPYYFKCTINGTDINFGNQANGYVRYGNAATVNGATYISYDIEINGNDESNLLRALSFQLVSAIKVSGTGSYSDLVKTYNSTDTAAGLMIVTDETVDANLQPTAYFLGIGNNNYYKSHASANPLKVTITAVDANTFKGTFTGLLLTDSTKAYSTETVTNGSFYMPQRN